MGSLQETIYFVFETCCVSLYGRVHFVCTHFHFYSRVMGQSTFFFFPPPSLPPSLLPSPTPRALLLLPLSPPPPLPPSPPFPDRREYSGLALRRDGGDDGGGHLSDTQNGVGGATSENIKIRQWVQRKRDVMKSLSLRGDGSKGRVKFQTARTAHAPI